MSFSHMSLTKAQVCESISIFLQNFSYSAFFPSVNRDLKSYQRWISGQFVVANLFDGILSSGDILQRMSFSHISLTKAQVCESISIFLQNFSYSAFFPSVNPDLKSYPEWIS